MTAAPSSHGRNHHRVEPGGVLGQRRRRAGDERQPGPGANRRLRRQPRRAAVTRARRRGPAPRRARICGRRLTGVSGGGAAVANRSAPPQSSPRSATTTRPQRPAASRCAGFSAPKATVRSATQGSSPLPSSASSAARQVERDDTRAVRQPRQLACDRRLERPRAADAEQRIDQDRGRPAPRRASRPDRSSAPRIAAASGRPGRRRRGHRDRDAGRREVARRDIAVAAVAAGAADDRRRTRRGERQDCRAPPARPRAPSARAKASPLAASAARMAAASSTGGRVSRVAISRPCSMSFGDDHPLCRRRRAARGCGLHPIAADGPPYRLRGATRGDVPRDANGEPILGRIKPVPRSPCPLPRPRRRRCRRSTSRPAACRERRAADGHAVRWTASDVGVDVALGRRRRDGSPRRARPGRRSRHSATARPTGRR